MVYLCMVKYLSFHNSSFSLRYFLMLMARPQSDTPRCLVKLFCCFSLRGSFAIILCVCCCSFNMHFFCSCCFRYSGLKFLTCNSVANSPLLLLFHI